MSAANFLRLKKLTGVGIVRKAARHNRRVIQAEMGASGSIDPARTHLNETLNGPPTADDVAKLASDMMRTAGIEKVRKDAVLALEVIFSLSPSHQLDDRAFFSDCVRWAGDQFGGVQNILSADIHRDEAAPHCHVLILPLMGGRMVGSDMVGNRTKLRDTRQRFHTAVGARYGLAKAPPRLLGATKTAAATKVLETLRAGLDGALKSKLWPQLRNSIEHDPGPYLVALSIDVERPRKKARTMAQIFTSKGKGKRHEDKPIGFASPLKAPSLCSVGFALSSTANRTSPPAANYTSPHVARSPEAKPAETQVEDFRRDREDDLDAGLYDPQTGEFFRVPTKDTHMGDWLPRTHDSDERPHWDDC